MPKVSEAHRDARREQIASAAIACLARKGFSNTTMADIIAESGLSAGAIYSNFINKAELARYVAGTLIGPRTVVISNEPGTPTDIALSMLAGLAASDVEASVVVQIWAESTVDPELHAVITGVVESLRSAFAIGIADWVAERYPDDADVIDHFTRVLLTVCQGYIVNSALFGAADPREYLKTASVLLT
jgi:AcrR family transcriptional regulator